MKLYSLLALLSTTSAHRHHHHHHHSHPRHLTPRRLNTNLVKFVDDYNDLEPELLRDDDDIVAYLAKRTVLENQ